MFAIYIIGFIVYLCIGLSQMDNIVSQIKEETPAAENFTMGEINLVYLLIMVFLSSIWPLLFAARVLGLIID